MEVVNMTPHTINAVTVFGDSVVFESRGVARVNSSCVEEEPILGIPTQKVDFGEVYGLPEESPETMYIVSGLVKAALPSRKDLLAPATGPADQAIRDEDGRIIGITRFNR